MIKTNELTEIVRTLLYTSCVKFEKPVSAIFISDKGNGKTGILEQFSGYEGVKVLTDVTYMGLLDLLEKDKNLKFIIIPDFLKITMKSRSTKENIISFLNVVIEEGAKDLNFANRYFKLEGRRIGLLTATTSDSFFQNQTEWDSMGFISRLITLSYTYSKETRTKILDYINNRGYLNQVVKKESLPKNQINVNLPPELAKNLRDVKTDFRKQKQLQNMCMARAIMDKRKVVNSKDIDDILLMKRFINLEFLEI